MYARYGGIYAGVLRNHVAVRTTGSAGNFTRYNDQEICPVEADACLWGEEQEQSSDDVIGTVYGVGRRLFSAQGASESVER